MATARRRYDHYDKLLANIKFHVGTIEAIEEVEAPVKSVLIIVNFGDYKREYAQEVPRRRYNLGAIVGNRALFSVRYGPDNTVSEVLGGSPIE